MKVEKTEIAVYTHGYRMVMGTNHPDETHLHRYQDANGKTEWEVVFSLCNGVPERSQRFTNYCLALDPYEEYTGERRTQSTEQ